MLWIGCFVLPPDGSRKAPTTALYSIVNQLDKDVSLILDYAFRRLFGANTNLLILSCIGKTKEQIMPEVMQVLRADTQYEKYANCKCKLDTCTVELSESERRSG